MIPILEKNISFHVQKGSNKIDNLSLACHTCKKEKELFTLMSGKKIKINQNQN